MDLKVEGRLIQKLNLQTGTGKNGEWRKQEFVIETEESFPKKICANLWSDKIAMLDNIAIGEKIVVFFNLESREFNGRWYTDVRAWKIDKMVAVPPQTQQVAVAPQPMAAPQSFEPTAPVSAPVEEATSDDLPF